jgi:hypothetical protein
VPAPLKFLSPKVKIRIADTYQQKKFKCPYSWGNISGRIFENEIFSILSTNKKSLPFYKFCKRSGIFRGSQGIAAKREARKKMKVSNQKNSENF